MTVWCRFPEPLLCIEEVVRTEGEVRTEGKAHTEREVRSRRSHGTALLIELVRTVLLE